MIEPAAPRLFLIDGYALIYRAFYALISRPLRTTRGENTSAVWGISNFLQRLEKVHKPEYICWVHDSGLSFRHEKYPAYKATREKLSSELQADFDTGLERIRQLLDAYHIPIMSLDGYEADDVIGTLVKKAVEQKLNVVVMSGDKDFQQLVREGVWLLNPGRGGPAAVEEHWVSVDNASERLGVAPERVTDYLALIGDSSDNVPGVSGIGDKTARELIAQYGDLESILAHAGELTKKRPREALLSSAENARLSKELVTIHDDLDVELDLKKMKVRPPDVERLGALYVELEFHGLALNTAAAAPADKPGPTRKKESLETDYRVVESVDEVATLVERVRQSGKCAVRIAVVPDDGFNGAADPLRSRIVGMSISVVANESWYLPLSHRPHQGVQGELDGFGGTTSSATKKTARSAAAKANMGIAGRMLEEGSVEPRNLPGILSREMLPLRELLEDASVGKIAYDVKFDMLTLRRAGVTLAGIVMDTMLASYVLDPGRRSHDLDLLALEFTGKRVTSFDQLCGKGKEAVSFAVCPVSAASNFVCEQADVILQLAEKFETQLSEHALTPLLRDIELPLVPVLAEMEWTGITIDVEWFHSLKERFRKAREIITESIYSTAGEEFNINSPAQLREILFVKLGLPVLKKTATGPSTDVTVLQQLADQGQPLPVLIMEYRELSKLESTYLDTLPLLVNPDTGRLHTSYKQTVASTGRLSSSDPNLQNIPIRRELGRAIRQGFVPRKGWKLMAADYSQIELRLLAHMSGDKEFVSAFRAGGDIHRQTASIIFGTPLADVTSEMRARAKTINFATIYGQGPHALSQQLGIEHAEAKSFIATYFERFSGIREYLDSCVEVAKEKGYVETIFGRRRYIPEIRERNFNIRAFGERLAQNSPIQGSAADLIKIAMIHIDREIRRGDLTSRMLLQVHDELVFEVAPDELDVVTSLVKKEMEEAAALDVPLLVDIGVGDNWLTAKAL